MTNLTNLSLVWNSKITGSCVNNLTNLTHLRYLQGRYGNSKVNFDKLTNLRSLNLDFDDSISDDKLSKLTNLTHLSLDENGKITNKGISTLSNLTSLVLIDNNNGIDDIGLDNITNLRYLSLQDWNITDNYVSRLTNLTYLSLGSSGWITNMGISNLQSLICLNISPLKYKIASNGYSHLQNLKYVIRDREFANITKELANTNGF